MLTGTITDEMYVEVHIIFQCFFVFTETVKIVRISRNLYHAVPSALTFLELFTEVFVSTVEQGNQ